MLESRALSEFLGNSLIIIVFSAAWQSSRKIVNVDLESSVFNREWTGNLSEWRKFPKLCENITAACFGEEPYIMAGVGAIKERRIEACDNFSDKCGSHLRPCVCPTRRGQPLWTTPPPHWTELLSKCSADKQTICASWENKHDAGGNLLL